MEYPQFIYLLSADPLHYGHINTKRLAQDELGFPINLVICQNDLKTSSLFSLEERKNIAQKYLPDEQIFTASNKIEIIKFISNAQKIVRGVRKELDIIDIDRYAKHYGVEKESHKLILIPVPDNFKHISSSHLKSSVLEEKVGEVETWAPMWLIELVNKKLKNT